MALKLRDPAELPHAMLAEIVSIVQSALWRDDDDDAEINEDKEWSADTVEEIAQAMISFGLGVKEGK